VFDSGSTNVTSSLFYDSLTNQWKFIHNDIGTNDASILLFGPLGNDIDNTPILTSNYLTKVEGTNNHGHHLTTSSIFDNGSKISINSNTEITGSLLVSQSLLRNQNILITAAGTNALTNDLTGSYTAAFYNYTLASASNARAGQFTAVWNGNDIQYMDNSTVDIGNTSGAVLNATLSNGLIVVSGVFATGNWNFKSTINLI
jgi:hypothetical protein